MNWNTNENLLDVHNTADGFLIALLRSGFSHLELRSFFSIGGYGCNRLVQEIANPDLRAEKSLPRAPKHAFTEDDKNNLKENVKTWNSKLDDGFPCAHRRKFVFTAEGVEWGQLHQEYEKAMKATGATVMGYSRWLQSVHFFFPEISLVRPKEDEWDGCSAINTELSNET